MSIEATRYEVTNQGDTGRFPRPVHAFEDTTRTMQPRTETVEHIRTQIDDEQYEVKPDAVANAILRRLLDGRSL